MVRNVAFESLFFAATVGGIIRPVEKRQQRYVVGALRGITMDLRSGDRVGLVGPNGSGKSTLLRVVAGGYFPTCGEICVNGRVSALLSIGLGMDFDDTGYANIEICGLLVGMTARENQSKVTGYCNIFRSWGISRDAHANIFNGHGLAPIVRHSDRD